MQKTLFDHQEHSFHNTISLKGNELKQAEVKARAQEDYVLEYFDATVQLTAENVHYGLKFEGAISPNTPLTSIRRAITNLCNRGKIEKLNEMRMGSMGKPIHLYRRKNIEK